MQELALWCSNFFLLWLLYLHSKWPWKFLISNTSEENKSVFSHYSRIIMSSISMGWTDVMWETHLAPKVTGKLNWHESKGGFFPRKRNFHTKTNLKRYNSWTVNIYSYTVWNCSKGVLKLECTKKLQKCIFDIYLYRFGWVFWLKKNAFLNEQQFSLLMKNILPLMKRGKFHYYLTFNRGTFQ